MASDPGEPIFDNGKFRVYRNSLGTYMFKLPERSGFIISNSPEEITEEFIEDWYHRITKRPEAPKPEAQYRYAPNEPSTLYLKLQTFYASRGIPNTVANQQASWELNAMLARASKYVDREALANRLGVTVLTINKRIKQHFVSRNKYKKSPVENWMAKHGGYS